MTTDINTMLIRRHLEEREDQEIGTDHAAALEAVKAEEYRRGQEDDREACAKLAKTQYVSSVVDNWQVGAVIAAAIRARGGESDN